MPDAPSPEGAELAFLALLLRRAETAVPRDATATDEERGNFFRAAGKYYRSTRKEIEDLAGRGLPLDEIPVALHLARHGGVSPLEVLALRFHGRSWSAILSGLHLPAEILHLPSFNPTRAQPGLSRVECRRAAREAWGPLELRDTDVVNLVNLKFISEHYGFRPEQVVALRSTGWTFASIHAAIARPRPVEKLSARRARRAAR